MTEVKFDLAYLDNLFNASKSTAFYLAYIGLITGLDTKQWPAFVQDLIATSYCGFLNSVVYDLFEAMNESPSAVRYALQKEQQNGFFTELIEALKESCVGLVTSCEPPLFMESYSMSCGLDDLSADDELYKQEYPYAFAELCSGHDLDFCLNFQCFVSHLLNQPHLDINGNDEAVRGFCTALGCDWID